MKRFSPALTFAQIAAVIQAKQYPDSSILLDSVTEPDAAQSSSIVFLEQEKFLPAVLASRAGLVICTSDFADALCSRNVIVVPRPYFAILQLLTYWQSLEAASMPKGIDPTAVIGEDCTIAEDVYIGPHCVIRSGCKLDRACRLESGVSLGANVSLGKGCILHANVVVYDECILHDRVILHSNVVIGADGFGYILYENRQQKIPQIGNVIIHNDVEIGAGSTIDRATFGSTVIGEGTKIDNLVQIGHNCVIGKHSILCAQVGLAGSTTIGDYVYLAGQVGVAGHLTIGSRAMIGAQSGVVNDIEADAKYFGSPAREAGLTKRIMAVEKHLPDIYRSYLKSLKQT